jgi:hypothetical protein
MYKEIDVGFLIRLLLKSGNSGKLRLKAKEGFTQCLNSYLLVLIYTC